MVLKLAREILKFFCSWQWPPATVRISDVSFTIELLSPETMHKIVSLLGQPFALRQHCLEPYERRSVAKPLSGDLAHSISQLC
jgi:hypothetical protein